MLRRPMAWMVLQAALLAALPLGAAAVEIRFQPVAEGVYAAIGETGPRTPANGGLNANLGLVVTPEGAVLIDSGPSAQVAQAIAAAVRQVTAQPVRWVVNTGDQDHRWLGNGYFAERGAVVIAHAGARADMSNRGNDQLQALRNEVGPAAVEGTVPTLPTKWLQGEDERLVLGGVVFEFKHRGGAHTPGDMLVWLPQRQVLFSGDIVFVDRMLGVLPVSNTKRWLASFDALEALQPRIVVPGHGGVTDLATAKSDTQAVLIALRREMKAAVDQGVDLETAVKRFDGRPFARLRNAAELLPGNLNRTYLEVERE
jgi:glyoxylase-like metal-dependent hydrolase (beta-lactamase superfamily II)